MESPVVIYDQNSDQVMASIIPGQAAFSQVNAATEYLKTLGSETSVKMTRSRLNRIARWYRYPDAEHCAWHLMRYEHIVAFIDYLRHTKEITSHHHCSSEGLRTTTINAYLFAIKAVAKTAWSLGQMSDHDLMRIRSIKPVRGYEIPTGRAMSFKETAALINSCSDTDSPREVRNRALFILLLGTGMRRAEIASIRMDDIDFEAGEIIIKGKGNKERVVLMLPDVEKAVRAWVEQRNSFPDTEKYKKKFEGTEGGGYLFCRFTPYYKNIVKYNPIGPRDVWAIITEYASILSKDIPSIGSIKTHDCRRTFATRLFEENVDISVIKNLMGMPTSPLLLSMINAVRMQ